MKIYRYISTLKAKEPKEKMPTHYLVAKENQGDEKSEFVASLWSKQYEKDGVKKNFLSGEMKSTYTDHTDSSKSREGYVIVKEKDLNELLKLAGEQDKAPEDDVIDESNIPF